MQSIRRRIARAVRIVRADRNPLARPIDRLYGRLLLGLFALFVLAGPLVAGLTAKATYDSGMRAEHRDALTRTRADAVVLATEEPTPPVAVHPDSKVRWQTPSGQPRTGYVTHHRGDAPGTHRSIWIDRTGNLTRAPRDHMQTVSETMIAPFGAASTLLLLVGGCYLVVNRRLDQRRMELWEREWAAVAPRWTGQR